jgi:heat-inducible transcriptional repressor
VAHDIGLTEREQLILQAVVHTYITSAEAVGSRTIVKRFGLNVSPATVRNTMADLEEAGYLQQLHTSSGRVPTDRGYRYYVDYLMAVQELNPAEQVRIEQQLDQGPPDADEAMRQASQLLAQVSRQTGLVEAPPDSESEVRRIEVVPITASRVGIVIADSYGRVRTITLTMADPVPAGQWSALNQFLNEHLQHVEFSRLRETIGALVGTFFDERRRLAELALRLLNLMPPLRNAQVFLEGATQLFEQPEFRDISRAQGVFTLLEERNRLSDLLRARLLQDEPLPRFLVIIGSEAGDEALEEVSLIAAPYRVADKICGVLGVLGPRRMPYSRLTAVVDYTAGSLGRHLTRLAG